MSSSRCQPCLDFFAGSGLVSFALHGGFKTVWANDISPKKAEVFKANHASTHFVLADISTISGRELPGATLSWGSFPCQDLSLAGKMNGLDGNRSGLFFQWLRVMDEMPVRPPLAVAENVAGLVSSANGENYRRLHQELTGRGYRVGAIMLDAVEWVPQSRKRIFVIAALPSIDITAFSGEGPSWCHPEPIRKIAATLKDWIWWKIPRPHARNVVLDDIIEWDAPCDDDVQRQHILSLIPSDVRERVTQLSKGRRIVCPAYKRTRNHRQVLELRFDGIAGCLRTPNGGSSRQNIVLAENGILRTRLLTVREAARLMGAPDSYALPGNYNDGYWAMGDAVAVPVARHLSEHLLAPLANTTRSS